MKMNLPNRLSLLRLCLVPVIVIFGMIPSHIVNFYISCVICAALFIGTAVTDMLDGKIARARGLITDFGKFIDPIADKFMVIGAMFVILYKFDNLRTVMLLSTMIVVFRELAVTSMRLVVSTGQNIVVAANKLGKIKTVSQIVVISTVFLEPVLQHIIVNILGFLGIQVNYDGSVIPLTWITLLFSVVMTVWSGINYIKSYWKYIAAEK